MGKESCRTGQNERTDVFLSIKACKPILVVNQNENREPENKQKMNLLKRNRMGCCAFPHNSTFLQEVVTSLDLPLADSLVIVWEKLLLNAMREVDVIGFDRPTNHKHS